MSLTRGTTVPPADGTRSSPTAQNFSATFPEGELTSVPGGIVKSSSSMNGAEALIGEDRNLGGFMTSEENETAITALVYEGNTQDKDVEEAEAVEAEFLASEDEDDDLHRGRHFNNELSTESLREEEESETLAEVPIQVDSSIAQGDAPQEIHEGWDYFESMQTSS